LFEPYKLRWREIEMRKLIVFLKHNLIDEFRLKIFPISLGIGKRLFGDGTIPAGFKLVESKASTTGVIAATCERAGKAKTGLIAQETPT
jgi:dihydrofolate reductase